MVGSLYFDDPNVQLVGKIACDNQHSPHPPFFTISVFKSRIIIGLKSTQTMILIIFF